MIGGDFNMVEGIAQDRRGGGDLSQRFAKRATRFNQNERGIQFN